MAHHAKLLPRPRGRFLFNRLEERVGTRLAHVCGPKFMSYALGLWRWKWLVYARRQRLAQFQSLAATLSRIAYLFFRTGLLETFRLSPKRADS